MKTYVIYNKNTGEIVRLHTAATISGEALTLEEEELLGLYKARPKKVSSENLSVLELNPDLLQKGLSARGLYVDVQKRVVSSKEV
jgi:hypothetical protein